MNVRAALAPVPIVVGVPRSGTTLLRLLLDAHPLLAIPPETGFLPEVAAIPEDHPRLMEAVFEAITSYPPESPSWVDYGLDRESFRRLLFLLPRPDRSEACRAFYRAYAARFGKPRFGDKTPIYTAHMPTIAGLLPEAHFIHLIRDGRGVALSWRRQWFAPSREIGALAQAWAQAVRQARAAPVPHTIEVRYERLLENPTSELDRLCRYLSLPFDPAMLASPEHRAKRLQEHGERRRTDGTIVIDLATRRRQQAHTRMPLDTGLAYAWRTEMSAADRSTFERVAGDLLEELGYPV
jgi:Sulfotransferase family